MRLLPSLLIGLTVVASATAARAATFSGTIVDVAQYVTGVRSTMTMNTDMMRNMASANGGIMNGPDGSMMGGPANMMSGQGGNAAVHDHDAVPQAAPSATASGLPMPMMSAMQGGMTSSGSHASGTTSMNGTHSMQAMQHCGTIGLLSKSGTLYLLMTNSSTALRPLCSDVGRAATITGNTYTKGGMRAIVATAVQLR